METPPAHPHSENASPLDRRLLLGAAGLAGIAALASTRAKAGPLTPPAGAVGSTGKTLTEVEPRTAVNAVNTPGTATAIYRITQPGSYYLTGNIQGAAGGGKSGIVISASGVTLDLNGFAIIGTGGTGGPSGDSGVTAGAAELTGITIRNGTIRNWNGRGINFAVPTGFGSHIENIAVESCGYEGIACGYNAAITNCSAHECGETGIGGFAGTVISGCTSYHNTLQGFSVGAAGGGVITESVAFSNGGCGIRSYGGLVSRCHAYANDAQGILASSLATLIESCTCDNNDLDGISVGDGGRVVGCSVTRNGGTDTVGAGIRTTGTGATVEGNLSRSNSFGYYIQGTGNLVVGNTAGGNSTNWIATANNVRGPIIDRTSPGSPAMVGDSAPSVLASTDPHANFTI